MLLESASVSRALPAVSLSKTSVGRVSDAAGHFTNYFFYINAEKG